MKKAVDVSEWLTPASRGLNSEIKILRGLFSAGGRLPARNRGITVCNELLICSVHLQPVSARERTAATSLFQPTSFRLDDLFEDKSLQTSLADETLKKFD